MDYIGESVTSVTSVTEPNHGEVVIMEWHNEGDRTFTVDEAKRWFKVALPLMKAAHDAPGGNDERKTRQTYFRTANVS